MALKLAAPSTSLFRSEAETSRPMSWIWMLQWSGRIGEFLGFQFLAQGLGMVSGLIIVRALDKQEYANFTIASAMIATMSMLSDSGITSGVSALGGRVCRDRHEFGRLITTALGLRKQFAGVAVLATVPILCWLLIKNGANPRDIVAISLAVLITFWFQVSVGVLSIVPRLALQLRKVQSLDLLGSLLRLSLVSIAALTYLSSGLAVMIGGLGVLAQQVLLKRWLSQTIEVGAETNPQYRDEILLLVKRQFPNTVYFCIQGQISIWLISFFGNSQSVAEVGALGRLAVIFSVLTSALSAIIFPRFARYQSKPQLRRLYWRTLVGLTVLGAFLIGITHLIPGQLLWLLGHKYWHLKAEVTLMVMNSVLATILGAAYGFNATRGWILPPWITISTAISSQVIFALFLDLSTVRSVLWMNCFLSLIGLTVITLFSMKKLGYFGEIVSVSL